MYGQDRDEPSPAELVQICVDKFIEALQVVPVSCAEVEEISDTPPSTRREHYEALPAGIASHKELTAIGEQDRRGERREGTGIVKYTLVFSGGNRGRRPLHLVHERWLRSGQEARLDWNDMTLSVGASRTGWSSNGIAFDTKLVDDFHYPAVRVVKGLKRSGGFARRPIRGEEDGWVFINRLRAIQGSGDGDGWARWMLQVSTRRSESAALSRYVPPTLEFILDVPVGSFSASVHHYMPPPPPPPEYRFGPATRTRRHRYE